MRQRIIEFMWGGEKDREYILLKLRHMSNEALCGSMNARFPASCRNVIEDWIVCVEVEYGIRVARWKVGPC